MITALIFDFDGLLVDTETPAFESWRQIYAELGQDLSLDLWKDALGTNRGFDALAHLRQRLEIGERKFAAGGMSDGHLQSLIANLSVRRQELKRQLSEGQPLLPGVLEILDAAASLGLPCAVASSSDRSWVEGWLARHGIRERFACVRTADDVAATKPAPDLFLSAAACLGRPPAECLVFEDSPNGIIAAHAAGMRCVAVPGPLTRHLALPTASLLLPSLTAMPLAEILTLVGS